MAPQALTLLNAEEVHDRALAFAARLLKRGRKNRPSFRELALPSGVPLLRTNCRLASNAGSRPPQRRKKRNGKTYSPKISITVMAEKTGSPADFWELLPVFESYQPDLQGSEVDAGPAD